MSKKQVLFLCTGNSCRSQMAQGLVNHFLGERWEAHSAGTQPAGTVHPLAIEAMLELGIDISEQRPKSVDELRNVHFDVVVTVCDDAAENCPVWLPSPGAHGQEGEGRGAHICFPDPAQATGSHSEQLQVFRQVRDAIRAQVLVYLDKEFGDDYANP
jgi:arsenate reductase